MKSSSVLLYLQRNNITVFTTKDAAKITKKPLPYVQKTIKSIPGIKMAEKGVYYTEQANIYEIASNIVPFSYVSTIAALKFYGLTTQNPTTISTVSPKKHRMIMVESYRIRFIMLKTSLIFGYVRRSNAFIAEPEKALLDCLYLSDYAYLEEAFAKGKENGVIDINKLVRYAQQYKKRSLINKVGFFLEEYCGVKRYDMLAQKSKVPVSLFKAANKYSKTWSVYYG